MGNRTSLSNRLIALALVFVMLLGMVPANTGAAQSTDSFAQVVGISNGVTVSGSGTEKVTAVFAGASSWVENPYAGDGWWVGIKVIAPEDADLAAAKYKTGSSVKLFKDTRDSKDGDPQQYVGLWGVITQEFLRQANRAGGLIRYTWEFSWDGDDDYEQTVILDIDADQVILKEADGTQVYPAQSLGFGTMETLTSGGKIDAEDPSDIKVTFGEDLVLDWVAKDPQIGRNEDGWWVGMKITAPTLTAEQADKARYMSGKNARDFINGRDSDSDPYYMTMWVNVNKILEGGYEPYVYQFDWNDDGLYEQKVTVSVDPKEVTLVKDNLQVYPAYGKVDTITAGGTVDEQDPANVKVVYDQPITLKWVAKDTSIGRYQDGWWIGVKITAPGSVSEKTLQDYAKYTSGGKLKNFWSGKDSSAEPHYMTMWVPVNGVLTGGVKDYEYTFDWNGDGHAEQKLTLSVDASKITLEKEGTQVFPAYGTVEPLVTGGTVDDSDLADVKVGAEGPVTLDWVAKDESIGRNKDGWWFGLKITAPSGISVETLEKNAQFTSNGDQRSFWTFKDSTAEPHYMTMWVSVNDIIAGEAVEHVYEFDWNGDGTFEQKVTLELDPEDFILMKQQEQVYPAYASVGVLTPNATVQNDATEDVTVLIQDVVLEWVPKDERIGRNKDGWWFGMDITVPDSIPADKLADAMYTIKGTAQSFAQSRDSERYMTVWVSVNEIADGGFQPREYTFDWMGDGNFEQKVTLKLADDARVILKKDGVQVYPLLGQVSCYQEADIQGNGTGAVDVTVTKATLQWAERNGKKAWWVGIRVDAPEGMTAQQLQEAALQCKSDPDTEWGETLSFWEYKDSSDNDLKHNIQLWSSLTPAALEQYRQEQRDRAMQYRFDWDGDGQEYEQVITFRVDRNGDIVLEAADQTGFGFEIEEPGTRKIGLLEDYRFTNKAIGGQGDGEVTYRVVSMEPAGIAELDEQTGVLTFDKPGTVTVEATKAADSEGLYNAATAQYTVVVEKSEQNPCFEKGDSDTVSYVEGLKYSNPLTGDIFGDVAYEIVEQAPEDMATIDEHGELTIRKAGTLRVRATVAGDKDHNGIELEYTLTVELGTLSLSFKDAPESLVWQEDAWGKLQVEGALSTGDLIWGIEEIPGQGSVAAVAEDGTIKLLRAGSFTITVYQEGNGCYAQSEVLKKTILVEHAEQPEFGFYDQDGQPVYAVTKQYHNDGKSFSLAAINSLTGSVTYRVDSGADVVEVDGEGNVRFLKAGEAVISATSAGNDQYAEASAEYTLTITKGDFQLVFGEEAPEVLYGTPEYSNTVVLPEEPVGLQYQVTDDQIGAAVDGAGLVSLTYDIGQTGTVQVTLTMPENDWYNEDTAAYTLTVEYMEGPGYTLSGTQGANGWYTSDVEIIPNAGHEIRFADGEWADKLTVDTEGAVQEFTVYFRDAEGHMSDGFQVILSIDKTDPEDLQISYDPPVWQVVLDQITFGLYSDARKTLTITISAEDAVSGIASLTYTDGEETKTVDAAQLQDGPFTFEVKAQYRHQIVLTATDVAGRTTTLQSDVTIVLDDKEPSVTVNYEYSRKANTSDPKITYTQGDVLVTLTIDESNFDLSGLELKDSDGMTGMPVFTVQDLLKAQVATEVALEWTEVRDGIWQARYTLSGEGDHVLTLDYTDPSGNVMETYSHEIHIDNTVDAIGVEFVDEQDQKVEHTDGANYDADRKAVVTIKEHNFDPANVKVTVTAKNLDRDDVFTFLGGEKLDYTKYAQDPNNWTHDGDVHRLVLPFTEDARYTLKVEFTDLAGDVAEPYETKFVVDTEAAKDIQFSYSESVFHEKLIHFFDPQVELTLTMKEMTSSIDHIELVFTAADDSKSDVKSFVVEDLYFVREGSVFTATYTLPAQADGVFSVVVVDKAGNKATATSDTRLVVDTKKPVLDVMEEFATEESGEEDDIIYTQGDIYLEFTINEANFGESETVRPVLIINDVDHSENIFWERIDGSDLWVAQTGFSGDGDYKVELSYTDPAGNKMETFRQEYRIDDTDPEIDVEYVVDEDHKGTPKNGNCYNTGRKAIVTVTEHNFKPQNVKLTVIAQDILSEDVQVIDYTAYARDPANWTDRGNDQQELTLEFNEDARYSIHMECVDLAGNSADPYDVDFEVDHAKPTDIQISYSTPVAQKVLETLTFGFYKAEAVVTVTAKDATSGVDTMVLTHSEGMTEELDVSVSDDSDDTFVATFTLPAEARTMFSVKVTDRAGNVSSLSDQQNVIVTDTVSPEATVTFRPMDKDTTVSFRNSKLKKVDTFEEAKTAYYDGGVVATVTIEEANFFEGKPMGEDNKGIVHQVLLKITKTDDQGKVTVTEYLCKGAQSLATDANETKIIKWSSKGDKHTVELELAGDGDYVLELSYADFSRNGAQIDSNDGKEATTRYRSKTITVDTTAPEIEVTFDNNKALNGNYYDADRIATIKVKEHNFKASEFVTKVTAKDILGEAVDVMDYEAYSADPNNWSHDGNEHTLKLPFKTDARYTFDVEYADLAKNAAQNYKQDAFVVDHAAANGIQIEYSKPVLQRVIEGMTFGFYKAKVVVTVTAKDITSGIQYFELTYTRDPEATDAHTDSFTEKLEATKSNDDGSTYTASFTLPAEARGSFSVKVFDMAGNDGTEKDRTNVIVTDTVSPEIKVDIAPKSETTAVHFIDAKKQDVDSFEEATNAFYNGNVKLTITVDEANFFESAEVHELMIKVTKTDDDGNVSVTEYLCDGAKQLVEGAKRRKIGWEKKGDTYTTSFELVNDGDYVLELSYVDYSGNSADITGNDGNATRKTYTSKVITVDKTAPVIGVEYENKAVVNTVDGRDYFDKAQSAVITVTEHNFRASDVAASVIAQNVVGDDVAVADFAAQLRSEKNWIHKGNVHIAKVNYTADANYTFDIDIKDLAMNDSADYTEDLFTVDTTAPAALDVRYSTSVLETVLESVTFGFYNAKMTVTMTAVDDTTGIYHFDYSYINAEGVSGVNAQLLDQAIRDADITYDGAKATAQFEIPKLVLGDNDQFNGTVEFTAYDRSENDTLKQDTKRIVVDNISPTAAVTYNEPVAQKDGISYYAGNIEGTISIQEANFHASDVVVSFTKDGVDYAVDVAWADVSVDQHTGTFTLTEEGDYFVTIDYKDKSGNQMAQYRSNELTLDTTAPTVEVSNIKADTANKDEKYGFTVTLADTNMDILEMKPALAAVIKNKDGKYESVEIGLGEPTTVVEGQSYTFTVEDLPDDGLYILSCVVKDRSGNETAQVLLEDGKLYDEVRFSINRNGSVFAYGDDFTAGLAEKYFTYSVGQDLVIIETNVDPVENYSVRVNGNELVEGEGYTTTQTSEAGKWSLRTYTISKDLFTAEGEYNVVVSSTDKADTTMFSDVQGLAMSFVVDQTAPVITITGLESGGRYQTNEQTVTLIPTDEGGRLDSLKVILMDADGNALKDDQDKDISVRFDMSGDELLKHLEENDGKVTFTIPTGLNTRVKIVCNDCANNSQGASNEYSQEFARVTVSQSRLVIFYANTPLFIGTIVGVLAVIALIIFLLLRKKDKKDDKKPENKDDKKDAKK